MLTKQKFYAFAERFHLYNHKRWTFIGPLFYGLVIFLITFIAYELFQHKDLWSNMPAALGNAWHFCEFNRLGQSVVQPSNTWSNLGFFVVGFILVSLGIKDHFYEKRKSVDHLLARHPAFTIIIGLSTLFLFFGSFMYHASLTYIFQKFDQVAMYFVLLSLLAYNMYKIFPTIRFKGKVFSSHRFIIGITLVFFVLFYTIFWKAQINILFPILIGVFMFSNIFSIRKYKGSLNYLGYLKAAFLTLLMGFFFWILDRNHVGCSPTSIFQGHALWHFLCAASIFFIYFFYRGEKVTTALAFDKIIPEKYRF